MAVYSHATFSCSLQSMLGGHFSCFFDHRYVFLRPPIRSSRPSFEGSGNIKIRHRDGTRIVFLREL